MCRACDDANPRRCPSSQGEARAARDRASYNAKKAATLTPLNPVKAKTRGGVKGGLGSVEIAVQPTLDGLPAGTPTIQEINDAIERVQVAYESPQRRDPDAYAALIEEHGSRDLAVVHVGELVAKRAEAHAGTSAAEIEALNEDQSELLRQQALAAKAKYGITDLENRRAEIEMAMYAQGTTPADVRASQEQISEIVNQVRAFHETEDYAAVKEAQDLHANSLLGETGEKARALATAYQTVLKEIRPMGGDMTFAQATDDNAREVFTEGAQYFPSEWIDASRKLPPMAAKLIHGRAHYLPSTRVQIKTKIADHTIVYTDQGDDLTTWNNDNQQYRRVMDEKDGRVMWVKSTYETAPTYDGVVKKPRGKEWEEFTDRRGKQNWRREHTKTVVVDNIGAPEILATPDSGTITKGPYSRAAIHELSHRMQHAVPRVAQIEKAFLERRTTHPDGRRHKQVNVSGGRPAEMGYADGFAEKYMGRDYGPDANYTELLATGSEALFSGSFGGLVGRGKYQRDDEMRGLILGLFASARSPQRAA